MSISRRSFLTHSVKAAAAAYPALMALHLLPAAPAHAFHHDGHGQGKKIIILGAGLAGMAAAYELQKLGYDPVILEARNRAGGRCWSIRRGTVHSEEGLPDQKASFDEGQYFNAGPSRIPHHHELTLHYCRELGVPIQVYNNINGATYFFSEGGGPLANKKMRVREAHNDIRGYMAELLAKGLAGNQLDTPFTAEETQKILEYLRAEGGLSIDNLYRASDRRGFAESPGAGERSGKFSAPHALSDLIRSGLLNPEFYNVSEYIYELQMTMFQAVGGMDKIGQALQQKVGPRIRFGAVVDQIRNTDTGVTIRYKQGGKASELTGAFCICTIPLPVLSNIDHNFSPDVSRAIDYISYIPTAKIGLQFRRRFWEEDEGIYGGITHTNNDLTQIFYPSNDYLGKKGILIGYYNFNEKAKRTGALGIPAREALALEQGARIHPQYKTEFETSLSVAWHRTPFSKGGWAVYTPETRQNLYRALIKPDQRTFFAGEHVTYLNAWMAGAFESARKAVTDLHARVTEQRLSYPSVR